MKGVFLTRRSGDWSAQFDKIPALHFIVQRRVSYVMNRSIASWTRCCHRAIPTPISIVACALSLN